MRRFPVPSRRTVQIGWYVAGAVLLAFIALLLWLVIKTAGQLEETGARLDRAKAERHSLAAQADQNAATADTLAEQIRRLGEEPVVDPGDLPEPIPGPPGSPGVPGPRGEPGRPPSAGEIAAAVRAYCDGGRCDGQDATVGQVRAAVLEYCNARGECRGAAGPAGEDGTDGQDGAAGAQGPPPSDEQVAQAVATYCSSRNECRGPQGPAGDRGPTGPAGQSAYPFTFTFTVRQNPVQSTTYTVTCKTAGEPCTVATQDG